MLHNENINLNQQINNKIIDMKKLLTQNEHLNEELDKCNEECYKLTDCLEQSEINYKSVNAKLNEKILDVSLIFFFLILSYIIVN